MRFKRLLALLLAAALALSLLAGCGGGKALSQVIVDLLDNLYSNVSVEADSDLTAALKQAAAEGGTEEEILSRMIEILNHKGGSITFTRLGSGQQGDHAVTLYFQTGTDPDAAARNALAQWASVLGTLPDDGSYQADVAMIETENGYYIALDVEVLKAGKPDKPDKDDDPEPEPSTITGEGFTYNKDTKEATISKGTGLQELFDKIGTEAASADITLKELESGETYTVTKQLTDNFTGKLKGTSADNKAQITLSGTSGLFGTIAGGAEVSYLDITVTQGISVSKTDGNNANAGAVAGQNYGTITGCEVIVNGTISAERSDGNNANAGGIAGYNWGTIDGNCKVEVTGTIQATGKGAIAYAGGIAGYNQGKIDGSCTVEVTGTIQATGKDGGSANAGGITGYNWGTINGNCKVEVTGTIQATGTDGGSAYAGGIASSNSYYASIGESCSVTLESGGTIQATTNGSNPGSAYAGGIVGQTSIAVDCGPATGANGSSVYANASNANGQNTATVSVGNGDLTDTAGSSNGYCYPAQAGTLCGMDDIGQPLGS